MWEGMASGHTPNYKRNKLTKSPPQPSDGVFGESPSPGASPHLVEAGLACGVAAAAASSSSPPTRRLSAGSSAAGPHRVSVRRLNARSRLGRPPPPPLVLSKTVQSLQVVRDDLAKLASSSCPIKPVNTISTQTLEQDEMSGSATSMISKRYSRIPVRRDRIKREKERDKGRDKERDKEKDNERDTGSKEDPADVVRVPVELYASYSRCNVFSVVSVSVSASKLQTIDSISKLSANVKPSVERREFCTVSQANVLACPEFKFRLVDVDTTLENWRPNLAELSVVTEPQTTRQKKKANPKTVKSKSKDKDCWKKGRSRQTVCSECASNSEKTSTVDSSDKEKSSGKSSNRKKESDSKTSYRGKTDDSSNNDAGGSKSEGIFCSGTTSGSNCRVHFSPQLTSSCRPNPTKPVDDGGKTESTVSSDKDSTATVSQLPDIIKRVTDQAITSIAKSVMLGLPRQPPSNDTQQTASSASNRHSSTLLANQGSFQLSRQPLPLTVSSLSISEDSRRRNPSQLSVSSLLSSHTQYSPKSLGRYKSYRSSAPPLSKTRKDFDNRHSQTSAWKLPMDAWYHDSATDSEYFDDSMLYHSSGNDRAALSFTRSHNWTRPHSRKRTHRTSTADISSWAMPSSSTLYLPEPMKYSRPSQRFSVKGNGAGLLSSASGSSRISRLDDYDLARSSRTPMSYHHSGFSTPRHLHLRL